MKKTFKKRAFISAIAMLIVSAIVLTSATYAWFSMAKKVEVESMELNVTSPEGIQISANTSAFTTKLTADDITGASSTRFKAYEGHINNIPETVKPSSTILENSGSKINWFDGSINDLGKMVISKVNNEVGSGFVAFDLFVKVKDAQTVKFGSTTVTCADNPEVVTAMRVALISYGTVEEKADASAIQNGKIVGRTTYELDATNHTSTVNDLIASGKAIPTFKGIRSTGTSTTDSNFTNIVTNTSYTYDLLGTLAKTSSAATINVGAGITHLRVYMWMEGNDVDCANDVAGSTINFNLVLEID